jgi:protein-disulfide isomerase
MSRLVALSLTVALAACGSSRPAQTGGKAEPAEDPKAVVAKFEGGTVTRAELDELVKKDLKRMDEEHQQQRYELQRRAADQLLMRKVLEAKAKAQGVTPEQLVEQEVRSKLPQPTDAEMRALYDQAKAAGQQLPPYEDVKPQIVAYLQGQTGQDAARAFQDRLRAESKAEVLLPVYTPPRVEVSAVGPAKGPADAPITIVEFSDFECPYCTKAEESVKQVMEAYPGKVRVVYRDFPLPFHPNAPKAAEAAHCAGDQGKYWEMHAELFQHQKALDAPSLKEYAKHVGLDAAKFEKCLDSGEKASVVAEHKKAGEAVGVTGTPAFFINGIMLSGAQPFDAFKAIIDAELKNPQVAKK